MEKHPVYEPREDSELLKKHIKDYAKGRTLDVGTGSGILAVESARYSEESIGVDINPAALEHCRTNHKGIKFYKSDLFASPKITGTYDLITFNPPYLPQEPGIEEPALFGGKRGYETTIRFIDEVGDYLKHDGVILLLFTTLTVPDKVKAALDRNLFGYRQIDMHSFFFEKLFLYEIRKTPIRIEIEKKGIDRLRYFNRGKRGLIMTGDYKDDKVAVKVSLRKETELRVTLEADWLRKVNRKGIGPKIIMSGERYLVYHFVEGIFMEEWIKTVKPGTIREMLIQLLDQCYLLDRMGVDKEEMHRPFRNLLIGKQPVLIDFERMHHVEHPKNVTQFAQFLASKAFGLMLEENGITVDPKIRKAAQGYKKKPDQQHLNAIKDCISLV